MADLRVMLVDDHAVLRAGLHLLIDGQPDMTVVAEAGGVHEAVQQAGQCLINVVVMDLSLPDGDGTVATERILQRHPHVGVIGLTRHEDHGYLRRMLTVGARGYILKQTAAEVLLAAIRTVAAGGTYIDPRFTTTPWTLGTKPGSKTALATGQTPAEPVNELTVVEIAVLQRVAWSHTNHEIAEHLGLDSTTVVAHKVSAMQKLGLHTRIDVLRYAEEHSWPRPEREST